MQRFTARVLQVLVFIVLAGSSTTAQTKWFAITPVKETQAINVFVEQDHKQPVAMTLIDADGTHMWSRSFNEVSFGKSIMLTDIPDGYYTVEARNETRFARYGFVVRNSEVLIRPHQTSHTVSPTVAVVGKRVIVDFAEAGTGQMVGVEITNSRGELLLEQEVKPGKGRTIRYDMARWRSGRYTLTFRMNDQVFVRTVRIK